MITFNYKPYVRECFNCKAPTSMRVINCDCYRCESCGFVLAGIDIRNAQSQEDFVQFLEKEVEVFNKVKKEEEIL